MKFRKHKYTYSRPYESVKHQWELIGPTGGIHFHVTIVEDYGPSCGLEFHHSRPQGDDPPGDTNCWLIGGRCWHDGTSLYASETLWPRIEPLLRAGNHEAVFHILESEYAEHFKDTTDEPTK